jgi:transcriptional regulator with XRE-family HTH domain
MLTRPPGSITIVMPQELAVVEGAMSEDQPARARDRRADRKPPPEPPLAPEVVARIKRRMDELGWRPTDLVAKGLDQGTVSKILSGRAKRPAFVTMVKIATALGVSAEFLATGKGPATEAAAETTRDLLTRAMRHIEMARDRLDREDAERQDTAPGAAPIARRGQRTA